MKVGTILCNCGGTLKNIDWEELRRFIDEKGIPNGDVCAYHENLCSKEGKAWLREFYAQNNLDAFVFAGCTPKTAEYLFEDVIEDLGILSVQMIGANLREHVAWVTPDKEQATQKAKALVLAAYNKAQHETYMERHQLDLSTAVAIIGAGPAGMQAAQDLATHTDVYLIDRNPYLGGNTTKLGLFFPSDDCAACLSPGGVRGLDQANVRRCLYRSAFDLHHRIKLNLKTEVENISGEVGNYTLTLKTEPTHVHMDRCVNCGLCAQVCPIEVPDDHNLGLTTRKAIYLPSVTSYTTKYVLNRDECLEGCTECAKVCPVGAIDLDQRTTTSTITVGGIILATGFQEYDPRLVAEYHHSDKGYEDVLTQTQLARILDITGPTAGRLLKRNGTPVKNLVMINCVGSRSVKYNSWCSNICCMIGLKHAIKIKEMHPDVDVAICYIDIRAVGPEYEEYYTKARDLGVKFVRGRPSDVESDGTTLYVNVEDSGSLEHKALPADMVVLSMSMVPSPGSQRLAEMLKVGTSPSGYFVGLDPKLRPTETMQPGVFVAGAAFSPSDIPTSVSRASHAAGELGTLLQDNVVEKGFPISTVDHEKCTTCELCVSACPFGAISVETTNGQPKIQVNPSSCMGCGQCVSTCPVSALDVGYYQANQLTSQLEGLLYDAKDNPDPIIVAFTCWECAYASTDYVGQIGLTQSNMHYPYNVRILPVQCTGTVSAQLIQKTFELGADGVLVVGCYEDRCHFDTGSKASSIRVSLLKQMLEQMGIDPRRLEKEFIFCSTSNKFVNIAQKMATTLTELGKLTSE